MNEEDSLNQHASNRSGSVSVPVVARETARSVQFSAHPDVKTGDQMNVIELVPYFKLRGQTRIVH